MEATREILWNSGGAALLWAGGALAVLVFIVGSARAASGWLRGCRRPSGPRLAPAVLFQAVLTQRRLIHGRSHLRKHQLVAIGLAVLLAGSVIGGLAHALGGGFLVGPVYLAYKVLMELAGVAVLWGLFDHAQERYIAHRERLENQGRDAFQLGELALLVVTGFMVEGARIAATGDPWGPVTPVGWLFSLLFGLFGSGGAAGIHKALWSVHMVLAFVAIATLPWTKMLHGLAVPLNVLTSRPESVRPIPRPPLPVCRPDHTAGRTGALQDCSCKQLLEADACIQCGRCRKWCPIRQAGLPDAPVSLLDSMRRLLHARRWSTRLVGSAISADGLWACTMCRVCEDHCTMWGEHTVRFVDLRRDELAQGAIPVHVAERLGRAEERMSVRALDAVANARPETWTGDASPGSRVVHIWPGCHAEEQLPGGAVLSALVRLTTTAGLTPVVLAPPACCGEPARRLGDEDLYVRSARANLAYLAEVAPDVIVTACPHCLIALRMEYAELGGSLNVVHHAEFLAGLLAEGRLDASQGPAARATYHDPCFLSRYADEVSAPREVLQAVGGLELVEIRQHTGRKSFCCGSGGGTTAENVAAANARTRLDQARECDVTIVATACPYCRENLSRAAGTKCETSSVHVLDIAELLLAGAMPEGEKRG